MEMVWLETYLRLLPRKEDVGVELIMEINMVCGVLVSNHQLKRDVGIAARVSEHRTINRYSDRRRFEISYAHGISDRPLLGLTIGQQLEKKVDEHPDKEAVIFSKQGHRLTFSQLLEQRFGRIERNEKGTPEKASHQHLLLNVDKYIGGWRRNTSADQLAAGLFSLGLKKGDRVGMWGPNSTEWLLTQYATARSGMILVNINPLYKQRELEFALKKVGCKALVAAESFQDVDYYETLFHIIPELIKDEPETIHSHVLPDLKTVIMIGQENYRGTLKFDDVMSIATEKERLSIKDSQKSLNFDEPINIQFTSGTTGLPKGVTLTHHNILNNAYFIGIRLNYHMQETRICPPVPLYHCFGMTLASMCTAAHGSTCVFPGPWFRAGDTLKVCSEERCTSIYGVPTMFIDMLNHPSRPHLDLTSLYTGIMAGAPCPVEIMKQVIDKMHLREITAKIIDGDGNIVEVGSPGEICTRGYTTMLNYWNEPVKTNEVMAPGHWYKSGDIGVMDGEGYCRIVGRIKDMIIRGGENIYAVEIEQILYRHPKVKDVQVVGVPDERLGEQIAAWIQLKDGQESTTEEIRQYCLKHMARIKVPKYVEFVKEYPLTVTGKVQKVKIREMAVTKLHLVHVKPH